MLELFCEENGLRIGEWVVTIPVAQPGEASYVSKELFSMVCSERDDALRRLAAHEAEAARVSGNPLGMEHE